MENSNTNSTLRFLIVLIVLLYVFSPDPVPGPVDDALVAVVGHALTHRSN